MKTSVLIIFLFFCSAAFTQDKEAAEKLVKEGVAFHDKDEFDSAIAKYDQALQLDKDNLAALAEKAVTLVSLQKYDESIKTCQKAIETHAGEKDLNIVYVSYGNATDALGKTDQSIKIYDQGIKLFPDYYQLYFNKGIALIGMKRYDDAMQCFQKSVMINPEHPGSHNAIARISNLSDKKIPSLLAYGRFLSVEPTSTRAKENLASMQKIIKGNAEKTGDKSITINLSTDMVNGATKKGKPKENDFSMTEMILSLSSALDYDDKFKDQKEVERFIRKFEGVCSSLKEKNKNYGFFWEYYVPYFVEMKDKGFTETFAYIAFATSEDPAVTDWLKSHQAELEKFSEWSSNFAWKSK
ncbi:MAG: tetratricopeptide repeat protein [Williamsia sp.]|nr:tetratricopeptide repeat protein [Williamsia sp.]